MEVKAQLNQLRISPRKVRLVANVVRGLSVANAETQLRYINKRASAPLLKLLLSAVASAEHNHKLDKVNLFVKSIQVDSGLTLKRWQPKAMGRATPILKKASKIKLVLDTKVAPVSKSKKAVKVAKTSKKVESNKK